MRVLFILSIFLTGVSALAQVEPSDDSRLVEQKKLYFLSPKLSPKAIKAEVLEELQKEASEIMLDDTVDGDSSSDSESQ